MSSSVASGPSSARIGNGDEGCGDGSLLGTYGMNGFAHVFVIDAAEVASIGSGGTVNATLGASIPTTIEGAFTGCDGALYLGDSGGDNVNPGGGIIRVDRIKNIRSSLSGTLKRENA